MNKFKADFATDKLLLDIPKPSAAYYIAQGSNERFKEAMTAYNSRLSYDLSPELKAMLTDGQVLGENEFRKEYQFLLNPTAENKWTWCTENDYAFTDKKYRRIIAIPLPPLPEAKTDGVSTYICETCGKPYEKHESWPTKICGSCKLDNYIADGKTLAPEQTNKPQEDKPESYQLTKTGLTIENVVANKMSWFDVMQYYKSDITDKEANYILWNETAYPFDAEITLSQIIKFFTSKPLNHEQTG